MTDINNLSDESLRTTFERVVKDRDTLNTADKKNSTTLLETCAKVMDCEVEQISENPVTVVEKLLSAMDRMLEDLSKEINKRTLAASKN
jgi:archaellum component FlaC